MRIMLQFPEGLKQKAMEEAAKLEAEGTRYSWPRLRATGRATCALTRQGT